MSAGAGHNSVAADQLRLFVERAERLIEERKGLNSDISDVMLEAKVSGYNPKMVRAVIKLRAMDRQRREEEEAELETYKAALGLA